MNIITASSHGKTDLYIIGFSNGKLVANQLKGKSFDSFFKSLARLLSLEEFKGQPGQSKLVFTQDKLPVRYILVLGLGDQDKMSTETLRRAGACARSAVDQIKVVSAVSLLENALPKSMQIDSAHQAFVEGFILSGYQFTRYLNSPQKKIEKLSVITSEVRATKKAIQLAQTLCRGVMFARDLVNTPAADMTPAHLAKAAQSLRGLRVRIHNLAQIKRMKMGAFLAVAQGSTAHPPYFIEMHYKPRETVRKKIALVGKGITFDSGGLSIKTAKGMETMKDDMAGAAAVLGLMSIVRDLDPRVAVSGYIAASENMVDGFSVRPGDIVKSMNGKTIEILNTDAEGRLTLADALTYAQKFKPDYIIDMATLTGACLVALGMQYSAVMSNDNELTEKIISSGKECGENFWELPLVDDYRDQIKSPIADLKNIGGPYAGTITAGLFLEAFIGKTKWAHLDIAGPAYAESSSFYIPRGGTGVMVRTLANLIRKI